MFGHFVWNGPCAQALHSYTGVTPPAPPPPGGRRYVPMPLRFYVQLIYLDPLNTVTPLTVPTRCLYLGLPERKPIFPLPPVLSNQTPRSILPGLASKPSAAPIDNMFPSSTYNNNNNNNANDNDTDKITIMMTMKTKIKFQANFRTQTCDEWRNGIGSSWSWMQVAKY